ncbi:hypothetical protein [Rodentibacter haemolyticus]|uniref:Uncharacterized protein n=1 Tax=Rodentibacter haemolyticus TaxID=2778911 RepID=A0ABX6UXZ8_9PAST|nr:hypothetical protein [Rodentibacter haemolyticus]QPB42664.1 hypothetical protein IHV77_00615 [Rodentibacter haemolyticus]
MTFNLAEEIRKMLELMDKSPRINRFIWTVLFLVFIYGMTLALPSLINAIANWQQLAGK